VHQVGYLPGISAGCTGNKTLNKRWLSNTRNDLKGRREEIPYREHGIKAP
jgi:hypothetical protein